MPGSAKISGLFLGLRDRHAGHEAELIGEESGDGERIGAFADDGEFRGERILAGAAGVERREVPQIEVIVAFVAGDEGLHSLTRQAGEGRHAAQEAARQPGTDRDGGLVQERLSVFLFEMPRGFKPEPGRQHEEVRCWLRTYGADPQPRPAAGEQDHSETKSAMPACPALDKVLERIRIANFEDA